MLFRSLIDDAIAEELLEWADTKPDDDQVSITATFDGHEAELDDEIAQDLLVWANSDTRGASPSRNHYSDDDEVDGVEISVVFNDDQEAILDDEIAEDLLEWANTKPDNDNGNDDKVSISAIFDGHEANLDDEIAEEIGRAHV